MPKVLRVRALNRALLHRQLLLERRKIPVAGALEALVGIQAQTPQSPYVALWSRLRAFDPQSLSALLVERRAVRMVLMRGTLHLVTARDALALRPVVQPWLDRALYTASPYGRQISSVDVAALLAAGRASLEKRPQTLVELRVALGKQFPGYDANALAYAVHYLLPLVQIPPRGLWKEAGLPVCTTLDAWVGKQLARETRPDAMVLRYLRSFGPASLADMQTWSRLNGLRGMVEALRPKLRTFQDDEGRELFDVPRGVLPQEDRPAPVRFLPDYDNALLGFADRRRILADRDRRYLPFDGTPPGTLLVDGFIAGKWKVLRGKKKATLQIRPFRKFSAAERNEVLEEAAELIAFAAREEVREVQLAAPDA